MFNFYHNTSKVTYTFGLWFGDSVWKLNSYNYYNSYFNFNFTQMRQQKYTASVKFKGLQTSAFQIETNFRKEKNPGKSLNQVMITRRLE